MTQLRPNITSALGHCDKIFKLHRCTDQISRVLLYEIFEKKSKSPMIQVNFRQFSVIPCQKKPRSLRKSAETEIRGKMEKLGEIFIFGSSRFQQYYRFFRSPLCFKPAAVRGEKGVRSNIPILHLHCVVKNGTPVCTSLNIARTNK